jgi:predicted amidohydrolase
MDAPLRTGIAQWLAAPGDHATNDRTAVDAIGALARRGCDLVVLPELWPCGYRAATLTEDVRAAAEPLDGPRTERLADAARAAAALVLAGTVPELAEDGACCNTALLFAPDGGLLAAHRKTHLYAPAGEERAVRAGDALTVADTAVGRVGIATCFDGDFPETARALRRAGARVVLHPSAYEVEAAAWWDVLYPANALANGQWWLSANQCGDTGDGTMLGGSRIIAPDGTVVAEAPRATAGTTPPACELVCDIDLASAISGWDATCAVLLEGARDDLEIQMGSGA